MQKTNIMQSETIPRLLFKMSFPMMLSMLIQALYNVVDSIFVAMVSETALTAVSLAFPLQNLLISAAVGTGVGINSLLSRRLGEGKHEEANHVASTSLFLAFAMWVLFVLIGVFLTKPFLALFTKDTELLKLSTSYSRICLIVSFGCIFSITIEKLIQATGNSVQPMTMQLTGAITNIILDPVFIFVFGLGVNGAAIATVIGQIASMLLAIIFFKKNEYISIKFKDIKPNARIIKDIFQVGLPSIIMNSIGTVMVSLINKILILFSATAVSVFGVYFKLQSFVFMPVFGLNNGVIPILGFNYGARNKKRMLDTMKLGLVVALLIMITGTICFQLFAKELLSLFSATEEMYRIGIPALRTISLCFIPASISIILIASFQATGFGLASMMVSIIRQLVVLCPCVLLLSRLIGINGVWYSFAIAEIFGLLFSVIFFIHVYNKKIKNL
ncbi:MATE family efflux transporter [Bullifex porci]|uniref:MATE family efflux transporter n=2 Tax=Bullifex porci TaxID=2606638 RepID=UPI0023F56806|nr:MATE family efflux transporter [Bullifex porci]MDD7255313.1 MATE family efflux transporter [Bullifex porci]MDY2740675.1 MATE family efflux transporter [Bullifex porci]